MDSTGLEAFVTGERAAGAAYLSLRCGRTIKSATAVGRFELGEDEDALAQLGERIERLTHDEPSGAGVWLWSFEGGAKQPHDRLCLREPSGTVNTSGARGGMTTEAALVQLALGYQTIALEAQRSLVQAMERAHDAELAIASTDDNPAAMAFEAFTELAPALAPTLLAAWAGRKQLAAKPDADQIDDGEPDQVDDAELSVEEGLVLAQRLATAAERNPALKAALLAKMTGG